MYCIFCGKSLHEAISLVFQFFSVLSMSQTSLTLQTIHQVLFLILCQRCIQLYKYLKYISIIDNWWCIDYIILHLIIRNLIQRMLIFYLSLSNFVTCRYKYARSSLYTWPAQITCCAYVRVCRSWLHQVILCQVSLLLFTVQHSWMYLANITLYYPEFMKEDEVLYIVLDYTWYRFISVVSKHRN
jgi:hypothetical protein